MSALDPRFYAFLGMCQAAQIAMQLATLGNCDDVSFETMVQSIFVFDAEKTEDIYGKSENLQLARLYFQAMNRKPFKPAQKLAFQLIRNFLSLGKKILYSPKTQEKLKTQLKRIYEQVDYFGAWNHPRVMANLGDLYVETANEFRQSLKISGQKKYLQDPENVNKIRTALFSGVRSAVLWYQLHGNLFWLFWHRKHLLSAS